MQLLGQPCNDIDIALDNMLGTEFTEKLNEYLSSLGKEKQKINQILRHQINLMISGKHPDQAMTYIWDVQIFSVIFSVPHS
ncbi:hypothetical protein LguiB_005888 [Lonicera macranthoides]